MNSADKQAVLHCLKSMIDEEVCEECPLYGTTETEHCEKDCVRLAINVLNSSEKPNKWIVCSDGLPEDHKDVLICLSSDQICIGCYNSHRLPFSNNVIGWGANYAHNWCSNDVVAWMPLPTPYQSEIPTGAEGSEE